MPRTAYLRLLGGASLEGPDGPVVGRAAQRHRLALLALLALEPQGISRSRLVGLLWPDRPDTKGRRALSDSVYRINRALQADAIEALGDRDLRLDPDVLDSDVAAFRRALAAGDWARAVEVYGGPFLDAFHLTGSAEFDHWADAERLRLSRSCGEALESLAAQRSEAGDRAGAVAAWKRRAALDPYDSRVAVELMRALEARGNPAAALRHADEHIALLARDLEAAPSPQVEVEATRIRNGEPPGLPDHATDASVAPGAVAPAVELPSGADVDPGSPEPSGPLPAPGPHRPYWPRIAVAATVVLVGIPAAGTLLPGPDRTPEAATSPAAVSDLEYPSLAVLAFEDLSAAPSDPWLGEGTAEAIAFALGRVEDLRVVSTHSSFAIGRQLSDVREIADTLGSTLLLDGSVRVDADSLRVSVALIDGPSGHRRWGQSFAAPVSPGGPHGVQARVALAVAAALSREVRREKGTPAVLPGEATYETYLEARYHIRQAQSGAVRDMRKAIPPAIELLEAVVDHAPDWPDGWASLGEAYHWSAFSGLGARDHWAASEAALQRALALDPDHPQAHASLGYVVMRLSRDYEGAERHFQRALELDGDQYWHCGYPNFLIWVGRYEEAMEATRRAEGADPLYPALTSLRATAHRCAGDFEGAAHHARRALTRQPGSPLARRDLALSLGRLGRTDEAYRILDEAPAHDAYLSLVRALLLAREGNSDDADALLRQIPLEDALHLQEDFVSQRLQAVTVHAALLVALERSEDALELLEDAVARNPDTLLYDRCFTELRALESDPRYRALLRRTGVPGF